MSLVTKTRLSCLYFARCPANVAFRIDIAEVAGDENAVEQASKSLGDLRIAEIVELDMQLDANGKVEAYRSKVKLSFKYEGS
jgi:flavin-binding protein dodecin